MYFNNFPEINYDIRANKNTKTVTDIFKRVAVLKNVSSNLILYDFYIVTDGETPELLARKLYGDSTLHWIILLINNIRDPYYDWPMAYQDLIEFADKKYGTTKHDIHHWENANGYEVKSTVPSAVSIDNLEYENLLNESKRTIKILKEEHVQDFIDDFENKMEGV